MGLRVSCTKAPLPAPASPSCSNGRTSTGTAALSTQLEPEATLHDAPVHPPAADLDQSEAIVSPQEVKVEDATPHRLVRVNPVMCVSAEAAVKDFAVGDVVPDFDMTVVEVMLARGAGPSGLKAVYRLRDAHGGEFALVQQTESHESQILRELEPIMKASLERGHVLHLALPSPATQHLITPSTVEWRVVSLVGYCGPTLRRAAKTGALKVADLWRNMRGVLQTLHVLHAHGFLHADIAPTNLCFHPSTRRITVIDMGEVKDLTRMSSVGVFLWRFAGPSRFAFASVSQHTRLARRSEPHPLDDLEALLYSFLWAVCDNDNLWQTLPCVEGDQAAYRRLQDPGSAEGYDPVDSEEAHTAVVKMRLPELLLERSPAGGLACLRLEDRRVFAALFKVLRDARVDESRYRYDATFAVSEEPQVIEQLLSVLDLHACFRGAMTMSPDSSDHAAKLAPETSGATTYPERGQGGALVVQQVAPRSISQGRGHSGHVAPVGRGMPSVMTDLVA